MKNWSELSKAGKTKRLNKCTEIFEGHSNNCLDKFQEAMNDYLFNSKNECFLNDAREEMQEANKYRGYTNYCPISEISELLA